ncbi:n1-acetylpolyamine oxidase [Fusarium denticulatum]|uniref:Amine oxidase n=1 Tax=Fusarium denticulatum TaxID=48507 RepID=A0A8H5WWJ3_9HYPO|nr:n1-acetylpolyamine oxidase [Fusarium denticulatum]
MLLWTTSGATALSLSLGLLLGSSEAASIPRKETCTKAKVAILGAGVAGITAAQTWHNASIHDFIILEHNDYVGGRMKHTTFGKSSDGTPFTLELGANWIGGLQNPSEVLSFIVSPCMSYTEINTLAEIVHDCKDTCISSRDKYLNASPEEKAQVGQAWIDTDRSALECASAASASQTGQAKLPAKTQEAIDEHLTVPSFDDEIVRFGNSVSQTRDALKSAKIPSQASLNDFLRAKGFGKARTPWHLLLPSIFRRISASAPCITGFQRARHKVLRPCSCTINSIRPPYRSRHQVLCSQRSCVEADHAICTFSVGVLQNDAVDFKPMLPGWKRETIQQIQMGTYTKIPMQFNETFWPEDTQYSLYADPEQLGYYPLFQSLSIPGFIPGSNILFGTVVQQQAYEVEQQSDQKTKKEIMEVLRSMFPDKHVPEPIAFMYPCWSMEEWSYGSYSNWPVGMTLEKHQNLRANEDGLWSAGEANSAEFFGYLQGAYFEGQEVAERITRVLKGEESEQSHQMKRYKTLRGTTRIEDHDAANGWSTPLDD